ncbi:MAG: hypothetical protein FWE32_06630 [Oscillospiraceae bacterium]|nr:hypothetical protein [Oscillospiraceae bacterium]
MKKLKRIAVAALILLALAVGWAGWSWVNISVTGVQAGDLAIAHVGGGAATTPDLEWEGWRWAWNLEVWQDGLVHEIYVDARTGRIIRHEIDN